MAAAYYSKAMSGHFPPTPPHSGSFDYPVNGHQDYHGNYRDQPQLFDEFDRGHTQQRLAQPPFDRRSWGNYYEGMRGPVLPPLQMQDRLFADRDYCQPYQQRRNDQPQQAPQKEEQSTGGVSATLDYEMEKMTDFVTQAAHGMYAVHKSNLCGADIDIAKRILPGTPSSPSFRKWVFQVLSATRLPSTTILLSLHYLAVRMRKFPTSIERSENQLYRLLTVSMMLGSKFLDDNTFINRSWSDVTGIKVAELSKLEMEWLGLIGFDLHADPDEPSGVALWIRAWHDHDRGVRTPVSMSSSSSTLSPAHSDSSYHGGSRSNRNSWQNGLVQTGPGTYTPISSGSGNSASGTPYLSSDPWNRPQPPQQEYRASQCRFEDARFGTRYSSGSRVCAPQYPQYSLPPLQPVPPFHPWNTAWAPYHGYGCPCESCSRNSSVSHSMASQFQQTVVG